MTHVKVVITVIGIEATRLNGPLKLPNNFVGFIVLSVTPLIFSVIRRNV